MWKIDTIWDMMAFFFLCATHREYETKICGWCAKTVTPRIQTHAHTLKAHMMNVVHFVGAKYCFRCYMTFEARCVSVYSIGCFIADATCDCFAERSVSGIGYSKQVTRSMWCSNTTKHTCVVCTSANIYSIKCLINSVLIASISVSIVSPRYLLYTFSYIVTISKKRKKEEEWS